MMRWVISTGRQFLPTPSARRATVELIFCDHYSDEISTHALREEGDRRWAPKRCCRW